MTGTRSKACDLQRLTNGSIFSKRLDRWRTGIANNSWISGHDNSALQATCLSRTSLCQARDGSKWRRSHKQSSFIPVSFLGRKNHLCLLSQLLWTKNYSEKDQQWGVEEHKKNKTPKTNLVNSLAMEVYKYDLAKTTENPITGQGPDSTYKSMKGSSLNR